jgi:hypothetical protein
VAVAAFPAGMTVDASAFRRYPDQPMIPVALRLLFVKRG